MKDILEKLWYSELDISEINTKESTNVLELQELIEYNKNRLSKKLNAYGKDIFDAYNDCTNEMHDIIERKEFIRGFKLGCRIMVETLTDGEWS